MEDTDKKKKKKKKKLWSIKDLIQNKSCCLKQILILNKSFRILDFEAEYSIWISIKVHFDLLS